MLHNVESVVINTNVFSIKILFLPSRGANFIFLFLVTVFLHIVYYRKNYSTTSSLKFLISVEIIFVSDFIF